MMEMITSGMGLVLLLVCGAIVVIFLWDFLVRIVGIKKPEEIINYKILYKGKEIKNKKGSIALGSLPVQFGRTAGYNNDIVVVPEGRKWNEVCDSVSRAWFFIDESSDGQLMIYAAEKTEDGEEKRASGQRSLNVEGCEGKMSQVALEAGKTVKLKAGDFQVELGLEE